MGAEGMTREEIIKGVKGCVGMYYDCRCGKCPYGPYSSDCVARLHRDVERLMEAQEPRLLTEDDFPRDDADRGGAIPCWKEPKSPTRREGWAVIVYGKWYQDQKSGVARYWTGVPNETQKREAKWL